MNNEYELTEKVPKRKYTPGEVEAAWRHFTNELIGVYPWLEATLPESSLQYDRYIVISGFFGSDRSQRVYQLCAIDEDQNPAAVPQAFDRSYTSLLQAECELARMAGDLATYQRMYQEYVASLGTPWQRLLRWALG